MRGCIGPNAALCGVGPGRCVVGNRRREVDLAALLKHVLRLRRFMSHFGRLATYSFSLCDQSAHYTQQFSSLFGVLWRSLSAQ
jgi:hypothetical protein